MTATEEFGIAAVEALAAGRPVIALGEGGVRESVTEGVTGTFFERCEPEALAEAVLAFDALAIDPRDCRAAAERFGAERFRAELQPDRRRGDARDRAPRPEERLLPRACGRAEQASGPPRRTCCMRPVAPVVPKSSVSP